MKRRMGNFRRRQRVWRFRLSKESSEALMDVAIKIAIESTNNKFVRASFIGIASAIIGFASTEPPNTNKIIAAINAPAPPVAPIPAPDPKPSNPPVVAAPPPVTPRDGDIVRVKTAQ